MDYKMVYGYQLVKGQPSFVQTKNSNKVFCHFLRVISNNEAVLVSGYSKMTTISQFSAMMGYELFKLDILSNSCVGSMNKLIVGASSNLSWLVIRNL